MLSGGVFQYHIWIQQQVLHILLSVSIRSVCHFVMFLWFSISRQLLSQLQTRYYFTRKFKKKPFRALKRLFPFGTRHLTSVQTLFEVFKNQGIAVINISQHIYQLTSCSQKLIRMRHSRDMSRRKDSFIPKGVI